MADFTKLSNLVNDYFTITKVWGYKWKMWDTNENKMLSSDTWQKDYQKKWEVDTDKGKLDLSQSQMAALLEAVSRGGVADVNERTFGVKSNGKSGMEIRYFFNVSGEATKPIDAPAADLDIDSLPF